MREREQRAEHLAPVVALAHAVHEHAIDLEDVGLEARNALEVRVSGAHVVEREQEAVPARGATERLELHQVRHRRLEDLERDAVGESPASEHLAHQALGAARAELNERGVGVERQDRRALGRRERSVRGERGAAAVLLELGDEPPRCASANSSAGERMRPSARCRARAPRPRAPRAAAPRRSAAGTRPRP